MDINQNTFRNFISNEDISHNELEDLFCLAQNIMNNPIKYAEVAKGRIMATLFYEPSTRTRLSFESAMMRLGGNVLGFDEAGTSSVSKGETIADTIRVISSYADICVMRHPKEGSVDVAAEYTTIPLINGGDGGHNHPTQTLTDLLTIKNLKGNINNLKIGFCGDLKFGRTVHSLVNALADFEDIEMFFVSPDELKIPEYLKSGVLKDNDVAFHETENFEEILNVVDIIYMTRVQKERFFNEEEYIRLKDIFVLDSKRLLNANKNLMIMHPLPRVNEISYEIDSDPRAVYFKQAKYGVFIRMALIIKLLNLEV